MEFLCVVSKMLLKAGGVHQHVFCLHKKGENAVRFVPVCTVFTLTIKDLIGVLEMLYNDAGVPGCFCYCQELEG